MIISFLSCSVSHNVCHKLASYSNWSMSIIATYKTMWREWAGPYAIEYIDR